MHGVVGAPFRVRECRKFCVQVMVEELLHRAAVTQAKACGYRFFICRFTAPATFPTGRWSKQKYSLLMHVPRK
jgi:hypothetical protein